MLALPRSLNTPMGLPKYHTKLAVMCVDLRSRSRARCRGALREGLGVEVDAGDLEPNVVEFARLRGHLEGQRAHRQGLGRLQADLESA